MLGLFALRLESGLGLFLGEFGVLGLGSMFSEFRGVVYRI